jgi:hypothetical protein
VASEVTIVNMALGRLGITDRVTSSDGTLANATSTGTITTECVFWYPLVRLALLECWYWRFARKYALLVVADEGDDEAWETEWDRAYTLPADCARARRFVSGTQAPYATWRYPDDADTLFAYNYKFVVRAHEDVKVILTNVPTPAHLEYTEDVTDATRFDQTFSSLLAWALAVELAGPLSADAGMSQKAFQAYLYAEPMAKNADANEEQAPDNPDDVFVASRG